jgi:hypothetical protein
MFRRIFRQSALKKALASYPVYAAPFIGRPKTFTREMAEANLKYLLDHREQRISHITGLLATFGVDVSGAAKGGDHRMFLDQLYEWIKKEWPGIYNRRLDDAEVWHASSKAGTEIVFSMLMDLGILLGQIILDRRPEYAWQLDLDQRSRRDDMGSFNSPVIQHQHWPELPQPLLLEPEQMMVNEYFRVDSPLFGTINDLSRYVLQYIDGAHEKYWLDHPGAAFASTIKPGRVVRYQSGIEGIACFEEPVPAQDWIDDQINAEEVPELETASWWGVFPFDGGYLRAPDVLLTTLRQATCEDFLKAVDAANVSARKALAELFPDYAKQALSDQRLKEIFGKPSEDRSAWQDGLSYGEFRKLTPTYAVTGCGTDSKSREPTFKNRERDWQISVVMTEKDERQFMAFLRSTAPISILLPQAPSKDQIFIKDLPPRRKGQRQFYLWNESFGPCTPELSTNVRGGIYVKSPHHQPILEYWRASPRDWGPDVLGRLYWQPLIDPDGTYRVDGACTYSYDVVAFEEWYELVVSWVRKNSRVKQLGSNEVHYLPSAWLWHGWYAPGRKLR